VIDAGLNCIALDGATIFSEVGKNFERFSKPERKVCTHDFDNLEAACTRSV